MCYRYILIVVFCLVALAAALDEHSNAKTITTQQTILEDWPIVKDSETNIELEFPGEFKPMNKSEGIVFGGQNDDGSAGMAVVAASDSSIKPPEELWTKATTAFGFAEVKLATSTDLSQDDLETFQVEKGFRQGFMMMQNGEPIEGVSQYIVYRGKSALIISWALSTQWAKLEPSLLFSLDTTFTW